MEPEDDKVTALKHILRPLFKNACGNVYIARPVIKKCCISITFFLFVFLWMLLFMTRADLGKHLPSTHFGSYLGQRPTEGMPWRASCEHASWQLLMATAN